MTEGTLTKGKFLSSTWLEPQDDSIADMQNINGIYFSENMDYKILNHRQINKKIERFITIFASALPPPYPRGGSL